MPPLVWMILIGVTIIVTILCNIVDPSKDSDFDVPVLRWTKTFLIVGFVIFFLYWIGNNSIRISSNFQ